jgi:valyl-tRNA synthetase
MMETGSDLLRQWVSRMILLGYYVTKKPPFKQIYFHGMVVDEHGSKMSKSKGNVVDPMETLGQYGSDALRLGLLSGTSAGNNQPYSIAKITGGRNFCNKLWNMARYASEKAGNVSPACNPKTPVDHWIVERLNTAIAESNKHMQAYRVGEAYESVYGFIWNDLADWYLEASKTEVNTEHLQYVLEQSLKLAHPFAPFVTEAIWQVSHEGDDLLMVATWPTAQKYDTKLAAEFEAVKQIVVECRQIISTLKAHNTSLYYKKSRILDDNAQIIGKLAKLSNVAEVEEGKGLNLTQTSENAWLDIDTSTAQNYAKKLASELQELEKTIEGLKSRLANKAYVQNAPKAIVQATKDNIAGQEALAAKMQTEIERYSV